jgi:hypothetical protein
LQGAFCRHYCWSDSLPRPTCALLVRRNPFPYQSGGGEVCPVEKTGRRLATVAEGRAQSGGTPHILKTRPNPAHEDKIEMPKVSGRERPHGGQTQVGGKSHP